MSGAWASKGTYCHFRCNTGERGFASYENLFRPHSISTRHHSGCRTHIAYQVAAISTERRLFPIVSAVALVNAELSLARLPVWRLPLNASAFVSGIR